MTIVLVLGAFCVLLTAGVLWAAAPLLHPARDRAAADRGHTAVEYWPIYS
ncbi:hypothetical protein [Arthrobacter sp. BE255]|nr:hypothetical protein [Arthrobacter sp. BE255]MDR7161074.1 hypothetical protein [Arthrobacter sp. BE255]